LSSHATAFAPGRVNLIGEHTDYNDGLALPFAIREGVTVAVERIGGAEVMVTASDLGEQDEFPLSAPPPGDGWRAFVRGAVAELQRSGVALPGVRIEICGTVPQGGGLSSSAALEVALALSLVAISGEERPSRVELARLCSRIENDWAGAETGLLDQLASLFGQPEQAMKIDFQSHPGGAPARTPQTGHAGLWRAARERRLRLQRAPRRVRPGPRAAGH